MAKRKDFTANNPGLGYTFTQANAETRADAAEKQPAKKQPQRGRAALTYRPLVAEQRESKSRRINLFITPTVDDGIRGLAERYGRSVNGLIGVILENFILQQQIETEGKEDATE